MLLLTAVAALSGWYLTEGRFTSAPPLTNVTQSEAETLAEAAELEVRFTEDYSSTVKKGLVVAADPEAGTKILKGGRIDAVVSRGPERVSVPAVVGLSQDSAAAALTAARLGVGQVSKGYSDTAAKGIVLRASKAAGTLLKVESEIDLVVSAGPKPIEIEDYRGKDAGQGDRRPEEARLHRGSEDGELDPGRPRRRARPAAPLRRRSSRATRSR